MLLHVDSQYRTLTMKMDTVISVRNIKMEQKMFVLQSHLMKLLKRLNALDGTTILGQRHVEVRF